MKKREIYICDLSHTFQGLVSEFVPYGIGCIKSYFNHHSDKSDEFNISLFKYPQVFADRFRKNKPEVVAFSSYIWNSDLSCSFAKEIKKRYPDMLIVFGGPNYPLEDTAREKWLLVNSYVDIYLAGEAEESFKNTMDLWWRDKDINTIKRSGIDGCHAIIDGKFFKATDNIPRLKNLDIFPSPYTLGYLDEFLEDRKLIPLTQTNRGCPFTCTYCEKGSNLWSNISQKSVHMFEEEIRYIAKKSKQKVLLLADNNFGMLKQDIEIAKVLARTKIKYEYPYHIATGTAKNCEARILECVRILKGSLPITASVQSLDPEVLKNIKRTNVSVDKLINMAVAARSAQAGTRSEIILGLPGDSRQKHFKTITQLIDMGMQFILPYTLILLEGSELNTSTSRNRWKMETKFRINHRCFGSYKFEDMEIRSVEIEEVVVGLNTMTLEDYLECRLFDLTEAIFYSDDILYELLNFLRHLKIKASDVILYIHENKERFFTKGIKDLFGSFGKATRNELWDDKEELASYVKSLKPMGNVEKIVGYNILFRHRAITFLELVDEIIDVAFEVAYELIGKNAVKMHSLYLTDLKKYMKLKKTDPFKYERLYKESFMYDFCASSEKGFKDIPVKLKKPVKIKFYHDRVQKKIFEGFNCDIIGIMRMIPRLTLSNIYRTSAVVKQAKGWRTKCE